MEGPQFSSLAESLLYKSWGCDVIGMTNMPEAKLAREAEICYASVAMVTDFDCWHPDHDHVEVADIIRVLMDNADKARQMLQVLVKDFPKEHPPCSIGADMCLDAAPSITAPDARDPEVVKKLDAIAGRVLGGIRNTIFHKGQGMDLRRGFDIKRYIRTIPDYPREGIMFRDITTLLSSPFGFRAAVDELMWPFLEETIDYVVGIEARGFILGGAVAHELGRGFVPVRKKGKLPGITIGQDYELEYGVDTIEIHADAVQAGG